MKSLPHRCYRRDKCPMMTPWFLNWSSQFIPNSELGVMLNNLKKIQYCDNYNIVYKYIYTNISIYFQLRIETRDALLCRLCDAHTGHFIPPSPAPWSGLEGRRRDRVAERETSGPGEVSFSSPKLRLADSFHFCKDGTCFEASNKRRGSSGTHVNP